jgi:MFS family permease
LLLAGEGMHASYFPGIFGAFLLIGLGAGASFMPLLTVGMADVPTRDAGLASGIINVSVQLFGAIGLATLGTIATDHTKALTARGYSLDSALTGGYHLAYMVGAGAVVVGVIAALLVLRPPTSNARQEVEPEPGERMGMPAAQAALTALFAR